jgi:DNA-binding NarL/FixJ family response regulator
MDLRSDSGAYRQTVLIVDHDERSRTVLADALRRLGATIVEAANFEDALMAAERRRPDLAITEVLLPTISGYELCRCLKERYGPELPVVFVSGERTQPADRVAGLLIGADDYLVKPVQPDELLARVRRLMPRTRASGRRRSQLTAREEEVLALMTEGFRQKEIAEQLVITPRTVAKHVEHILSKFDVHSRTEAVVAALRDEWRSRA